MSFLDTIRDRVTSVCAGDPFRLVETATPFNFDLQPTGTIDGAFRITTELGVPIGGFNYSEQRTDSMIIWVARKQTADPKVAYRQLVTDASSLRAAVIRDGLAGDYDVPDAGSAATVQPPGGREYAVLRLSVPVAYETSV